MGGGSRGWRVVHPNLRWRSWAADRIHRNAYCVRLVDIHLIFLLDFALGVVAWGGSWWRPERGFNIVSGLAAGGSPLLAAWKEGRWKG